MEDMGTCDLLYKEVGDTKWPCTCPERSKTLSNASKKGVFWVSNLGPKRVEKPEFGALFFDPGGPQSHGGP